MDERSKIVVRVTIRASRASVWHAITDVAEMRQWYFDSLEKFEPQIGFQTAFIVRCGQNDYLHQWHVLESIPTERIAYSWRYGGVPGDSTVDWQLTGENGETRLTLTHEVHQPFPEDNPDFQRASCEQGWTYFLFERLKPFIEAASA